VSHTSSRGEVRAFQPRRPGSLASFGERFARSIRDRGFRGIEVMGVKVPRGGLVPRHLLVDAPPQAAEQLVGEVAQGGVVAHGLPVGGQSEGPFEDPKAGGRPQDNQDPNPATQPQR
jgi:hypothetical protein